MNPHEWEEYQEGIIRIKVEGGYLYQAERGMCFVPDVDLHRYQAHLRDAYNKGFADGLEEGKAHRELMTA